MNTKPMLPILALAISVMPLAQAGDSIPPGSIRIFYVQQNLEGEVPSNPVLESAAKPDENMKSSGRILVDTTQRFQTMKGIGAAFSEIGTLALAGLPAESRDDLLKNLFDVKGGAGLSFCRLPVGASDFATSAFSYAETPEDYELKDFSLARDEKSIIPAVQAALKINPAMSLFASPWSPPGWMKESGKMDGGGEKSRLRDEGRVYAAYALYLERYIQGYRAKGIPIERLCPQNEVDMNPVYPGCIMKPDQMVKLVTGYLAPQFQASKIPTEIWPGTFREKANQKATVLWATECMKDDGFRAVSAGLGIQYYDGQPVQSLKVQYPGLRLMHTEAKCDGGKNTANEAKGRLPEMIGHFQVGCDNYCYWNMLLDENQKSGWNWKQNSLVTIDRTTGKVRYNPDYQPIYLASKFVRPGAVRVFSDYRKPNAAFEDKDKNITILVQGGKEAERVDLIVDGKKCSIQLPASSDCAIVVKKP